MTPEKAKELLLLVDDIGSYVLNPKVRLNIPHIKQFIKLGEYQRKGYKGDWETCTDICFDLPPEYYRPVPPQELDYKKVLVNGGYLKEFKFNNYDNENFVTHQLCGYCEGAEFPFLASNGYCFKYCKPLEFNEILYSWYTEKV